MPANLAFRLLSMACFCEFVLTVTVSPSTAWAVSATATVTAVDPNGAGTYSPVSPPGQQTVSGPTTAIAQASETGPSTFATSGMTAKLSGTKLTKTPSGSAGAKPGYSLGAGPPVRSATFSSTSTATIYQIHESSDDPSPVPLSLKLVFPNSGDPSLDPFLNGGLFSNNFGGAQAPSQGVVRDNAGLSPSPQLNSFFDVTYSVQSSITQNGNSASLFSGQVVFHTDGSVSTSGGFAPNIAAGYDGVTGTTATDPGGNPNALLTTLNDLPNVAPSFALQIDTDFDLVLSVIMSMGDPNNPNNLPANLSGRSLGAGGSFAVVAEIVDPDGNDISSGPHGQYYTLVPEPSSIVLAALAGLSLAGYGWQKRIAR